ncbi:hypothetical protein LCGC14_0351480 [marine sediment metagenome]|uniref:Uncharacterized protein n=1 Tax=marine sediment metagenome TaxID=412755 RepID=A0A0F9TGA2_9ZZZZ
MTRGVVAQGVRWLVLVAVIVALAVLIIIQQRTINDYKIITQAHEQAGQEYREVIAELVERIK